MSDVTTVGLDLAKNMFQVHGADGAGRAVLCKKLQRDQVLAFFCQLPPCVVAMEACGGAHLWGREIGKLGHEVRLIPPAYVKPFVKRQKNDAADAEAKGVTHFESEPILHAESHPQYVRPFVKRQKNDATDAEAIVIAARQPEMRFVLPKTVEQQAKSVLFRNRERLVRQRTELVSALRSVLVGRFSQA